MRGGTDDLHTALVGPVVGLGTLKGWQEAVVDVDGVAPVALAEAFTEDLHVPAHTQYDDNTTAQQEKYELDLGCQVSATLPKQNH